MRRRIALISAALAIGSLLVGPRSGATEPESAGAGDERARLVELGGILAFQDSLVDAEAVFAGLLADDPEDAGALNNLGNVNLLRDSLGIALAFYDEALRHDPKDPGIHFNRMVALRLMGLHDEAARESETPGIRNFAANLYNLREGVAADTVLRAAGQTYLTRGEILALLKGSRERIPTTRPAAADSAAADSIRTEASSGRPEPTRRTLRGTRPGGVRASDAADLAGLLYWRNREP